MHKTQNCKLFIILLILTLTSFAKTFADSRDAKPIPYAKNEFPQWVKDMRRTEIITLGSLPFVTLSVSLGFSIYKYADHNFDSAYIPTPFTASSTFSSDDQISIIVSSCLISLGLGVTDLLITFIKRGIEADKKGKLVSQNVKIIPQSNTNSFGQPNFLQDDRRRPTEYLFGDIESAVF